MPEASPYGPNPFTLSKSEPSPTAENDRIRLDWTADAKPADLLPWERKAAEIEARTKELCRKEEELRAREHNVREMERTTVARPLAKNWPPFFPLVVHDIDHDLPANGQALVKSSFLIWKMTAVAYLLNLLASVGFAISGVSGYGGIGGPLLAIFYLALFPTVGFFSWHMGLYRAVKSDSSLWFVFYFVAFGIQLLFYAFLGLGFVHGGGGGVLAMIAMFAAHKWFAGLLSAVCAGMMVVCLVMGLWLARAVVGHYRGAGHSMERATGEAAGHAARNPAVRNAAISSIV